MRLRIARKILKRAQGSKDAGPLGFRIPRAPARAANRRIERARQVWMHRHRRHALVQVRRKLDADERRYAKHPNGHWLRAIERGPSILHALCRLGADAAS